MAIRTPSRQSRDALDDAALVRLARVGDEGAFGELVERHRSLVVRVAARIVGPDEAEDVAQDAFLRAFHRLANFRGDAPFRAWLMRIAHHAALDARARRRSEPIDDTTMPEEAILHRRTPAEPASQLEDSERRDRLQTKIEMLKPQHRSVLVLRDLAGLSYEEVAFATETPLGSVKGRLHRARTELIDLLRNNTYDWELPG